MTHRTPLRKTLQRGVIYAVTLVFTLATFYESAGAMNAEDFDAGFAGRNNIEFYHPCGGDSDAQASKETPGEYVKLGKIPVEGLIVGGSVFGGKQQGGKWVANWADNNGDDMGNHDNHLTGTASFAELTLGGKLGDALGDIPNGSKLEIIYKSGSNVRKIIAEKGDVGTGGDDVTGIAPAPGKILPPKNKEKEKKTEAKAGDSVTAGRAVDLWWEAANLLGVDTGTPLLTVHALDKNTKTTPVTGKATAGTATDTGESTDAGACCAEGEGPTGDGTLIGSTNKEKIWNFLVGNDGQLSGQDALNAEQAAGLMGNIQVESTFRPEAENSIGAFGIVQWLGGRRTNLEKAAKKKGVKPTDLNLQLHFLVEESKARTVMNGAAKYGNKGKSEWATLKKQDTIYKAADFWNVNFEISGTSSTPRANNGKKIYAEMTKKYPVKGGGGGGASSGGGGGGGSKPTVFLDPGHGGTIPDYTDEKSKLVTNETNNGQEDKDVLEVANKVKAQLEKQGYKVEMARTKNNMSASETPKFRERADAAARAKASIGISIHTSPGGPNDAWSQRKDSKTTPTFRESKNGSNRTPFTNGDTATKSQAYARAIAAARSKTEGHKVGLDSNHQHQTASFGRGGNIKSPGNIPLVALFSEGVPWVYNEIEQDKGEGLSAKRKEAYAKGIVQGVIDAKLPGSDGEGGCGGDTNASGLAGKTLAYAWPEHSEGHSPPKPPKRKAYDDAVKKARKEGRYVGNTAFGDAYVGVDCGGFVTTLMIDSGFEPKYNSSGKGGYTIIQEQWLKKNWKPLGTGADISIGAKGKGKTPLQPGDVAINNNHTFVYVGKVGKDPETGKQFETEIASASYAPNSGRWRAPMAGVDPATSSAYRWYRKK